MRERSGDIPLLVEHFLTIGAARFGRPKRPLGATTLAWFERYAWPGNIRELEHTVYHGLLLCDGAEIDIEPPAGLIVDAAALDTSYRRAKADAIAAFERAFVSRIIDASHGNVSVAARMAGTERRHFGRLLKKHRISGDRAERKRA